VHLQSSAAAARRDLAWLRKGSVGSSGLKSLGSSTPDGPVREAEKRLTEAAVRLAARDEQLLERLSRLSMLSVEVARGPWATLTQIQAEFFMSQQAIYRSLTAPFEELASGCGADQSGADDPARSPFA